MIEKPHTIEQALQKIRHYCAYQERCHLEVSRKLLEMGLPEREREAILANLIEENYLNEERFAICYAGGKFRLKGWGRKKIAFALRGRGISEYCIRAALKEIDAAEYAGRLKILAQEKLRATSGHAVFRKKMAMEYLIRKGYEPALASRIIDELLVKKRNYRKGQ